MNPGEQYNSMGEIIERRADGPIDHAARARSMKVEDGVEFITMEDGDVGSGINIPRGAAITSTEVAESQAGVIPVPNWSLKVKKLHPNAKLPEKGHPSDLGWDLFCVEGLDIAPGARVLVKTGIAIQFPDFVGGILKDRSSVASKMGLFVHAGVIDPNYRGEIMVLIHNNSIKPVGVDAGAKIAQMVLMPTFQVDSGDVVEVEELDDTDRGAGGFGSTGS